MDLKTAAETTYQLFVHMVASRIQHIMANLLSHLSFSVGRRECPSYPVRLLVSFDVQMRCPVSCDVFSRLSL